MAPQRTRTQVLAEESVRAFIGALPSGWIKREETPDYGIDVDVEIAEEDRPTTGLRFHSQIKGTDSDDASIIDVQYYKLEWLEYYRQLAQPVLLVRYSSARDELRCRWAHSVNLHPGDSEVPKVRVDFDHGSAFSGADPERIRSDVLAYRYWKESVPRLPITLAVNSEDVAAGRRVARMLQNTPTRPHSLLVMRQGQPRLDDVRLDVEASLIRVSAADLASMSVDIHQPFEDFDPTFALDLVRVLLAVVLSQLNRAEAAHSILPSNLGPVLGMYPAAAHRVAELLLESARIDELLGLWDRFIDLPTSEEVVWQLMGGVFHFGPQLDPEGENQVRRSLASWKDVLVARSQVAEAGQATLAEGVFLFETGHFRDALRSLIQACRLSSDIGDWLPYKQHLAAALFESRRRRLAIKVYEEIYVSTGDSRSLCRLADCLLFAGDYQASAQRFREAFAVAARSEQHIESIWILRHHLAEELSTRSEQQLRKPLLAAEALEVGPPEDALELDYLHADAWAALAHRHLEEAQYSAAQEAFTTTAAIDKNNVDAIAHAVNLTFSATSDARMSLLPLLDLGARAVGVGAFLEMVEEDLGNQVPEDEADAQRAIRGMIEDIAGLWGPIDSPRPGPLFVVPLPDEEEE